MSAFTYVAYDKGGTKQKGVMVADGEAHARALLAKEGLFVEKLTETRERESLTRGRILRRTTLTLEDLAVFTRQIAILFSAQIPVDEALRALMSSQSDGQVSQIAAELQAHIHDGLSLSAAMGKLPGAFPDYYRSAIAAGESMGGLERVCEVLADFIESRLAMRDKTVTSLVYPLFVGAVSLVVAAILLINVVPEVALLFEQTGQPLPGLTLAAIGLGEFLAAYWMWLAIGILGGALGLRALFLLPGPRLALHSFILRIPVFGPIAELKGAVLYLRTLALVLAADIPATKALRYAAEAIDNLKLRREAAASSGMVEEGQRIAAALRTVPGLPLVAQQMLESGE
ncbi:MAG: type II secretion system F family protein, partial [Pseudomonadota bacterium]